MKTTASTETLREAMRHANEIHDGNVTWNRFPEGSGKYRHFTLPVQSSQGSGHRLGQSGRRMTAACWHVHRDFMRRLFEIEPDAVLVSGMARYDGASDFEDKHTFTAYQNIGSQVEPLQMADACECVG